MKVIIWGTGNVATKYMKKGCFDNVEILAFIDNDEKKWGNIFFNIAIYPPKKLCQIQYDEIIICLDKYIEVREQIINELQIDESKVVPYFEFEGKILCESLIRKYKGCKDQEIESIISYYQDKGFNLFGDYECEESCEYEVFIDEDGYPYIWFENSKMFFPKDFPFMKKDGKLVCWNILAEQGRKSPHLYIRDEEKDIKKGAVIVDAGVCEGNFALRYVKDAKKIYLIESDPKWIEVLEKTFEPFDDKVVICNKYLGRNDKRDSITLDTLIKEEVDFIKMDIEGAEVDALLGAKEVLRRSKDIKCAICSYHNKKDEDNIRFILEAVGMRTETSRGYMCFQYDDYILTELDFRKGVIYADK